MKAVIFHGWGANSKDNWFPWLKSELETLGYEVSCPDLPDSQTPDLSRWLDVSLPLVDPDTVLIGHSLGCVLILRILEQKKSKAAFLVSGFDVSLGIEEHNSFFLSKFDYEKIKRNAKIYMLNSDNDPYIGMSLAKEMSKRLGCPMTVFHNKGHLSNGTGDRRFHELLDMIEHDNC